MGVVSRPFRPAIERLRKKIDDLILNEYDLILNE